MSETAVHRGEISSNSTPWGRNRVPVYVCKWSGVSVCIAGGTGGFFFFRHKYNNQGPDCRRICMVFFYVSRLKIYPDLGPRDVFFFCLVGVGWSGGGEKNVGAWGCLYEEISCEVSVRTVSILCQLVAG